MLREINLIWEIQVCMSKETEKDATVRLGITEDELHSILSAIANAYIKPSAAKDLALSLLLW